MSEAKGDRPAMRQWPMSDIDPDAEKLWTEVVADVNKLLEQRLGPTAFVLLAMPRLPGDDAVCDPSQFITLSNVQRMEFFEVNSMLLRDRLEMHKRDANATVVN